MRKGPRQSALAIVCLTVDTLVESQGQFVPRLVYASGLSLTSLYGFLVGHFIGKKMII